ncbi:MAG: cupin domain-containing protein [Calditrichia bacterium]
MNKVDLQEKFSLFSDQWTPKVVAELNGQHVKLARIEGELPWHFHENEDELFMVIEGEMTLELRDRKINLKNGELFVVPKGVEHKPIAKKEALIMLFEPASTSHTGNINCEQTVETCEWI